MRRPAKLRKPQQYGYYLVGTSDWEFSYLLSSHSGAWDKDPYSEYATIEVNGHLVGPTSSGCSTASISLAARHDMAKEARVSAGPKPNPSVGYVEKHGDVLRGYVSLSETAFYGLIPLFAADRLRALVLYGSRLFRRKALITSLSVESTINIEDYPSDYC